MGTLDAYTCNKILEVEILKKCFIGKLTLLYRKHQYWKNKTNSTKFDLPHFAISQAITFIDVIKYTI